ncbi:MAG TPA: phosphoribosylanthranilate isomerase, partial [Hellea balneolensis]|nr:phosphoribosylanthranilate isomerase [Hellea balneolensis]
MDIQVKICGLTRPQDVEAAVRYGADYLGFVVACESPRALGLQDAAHLIHPVRGTAKTVVVTVNPSDHVLAQIVRDVQPDYVQLHGDESPARIVEIKQRTGLSLIKAFPVFASADLHSVIAYESCVDMMLLDAKSPKNSAQKGGHGVTFDWDILTGFRSSRPLILAGGLNGANILAAKRTGIK